MARSQEVPVGGRELWDLERESCFLGNSRKAQPAVGKISLNLTYSDLFSLQFSPVNSWYQLEFVRNHIREISSSFSRSLGTWGE